MRAWMMFAPAHCMMGNCCPGLLTHFPTRQQDIKTYCGHNGHKLCFKVGEYGPVARSRGG